MINMKITRYLKKRIKKLDIILFFVPIILVLVSGLLIASTQRQADFADWYQHWITAAIGLFFALFISRISVEKIRIFIIPIYIITIASLIAVKFIGVSALGSQRWLSIGGVNFQPSELAKLTAILILAIVLDSKRVNKISDIIRPLIIVFIPWIMVFIQPDLGTSLVFGAIVLSMLFWAGMSLNWIFLGLSGIGTALLSGLFTGSLLLWIPFIGYISYKSLPKKILSASLIMFSQIVLAIYTPWLWMNILKDYQRERLVLFLDPYKDPLGGGYHLLQSMVGIGSGQVLGTGLLQGELTKLRFIPEQHTDFIFSALGEETGFIGTCLVLFCFFILMLRILKIAFKARSDFESLIVIGIGSMLMFQVVVNIFMNIGLGPVTGIPLPFMSYGRTSLLVNFVSIGLCMSISRRGYDLSGKL